MSDAILLDGVEFKQVPGWPWYAVSREGGIIGCRVSRGPDHDNGEWAIRKASKGHLGYSRIGLCREGKQRKQFLVHRLVLLTWLGPCPVGCECRHLNGCSSDNRLENLAWGTREENMNDRETHGVAVRGARVGSAKLTEQDIPEIRRLLATGVTQESVGKKFGVGREAIGKIKRGERWSHTLQLA